MFIITDYWSHLVVKLSLLFNSHIDIYSFELSICYLLTYSSHQWHFIIDADVWLCIKMSV